MVNSYIKIAYILWRFLKGFEGFDYYLDNTESNFKITRALLRRK